MRRYLVVLSLLSVVALALIGCAVVAAEAEIPNVAGKKPVEVLKFDMAEDFTHFVFDPDIVQENGFPVHGNTFITQGYLYPEGTLTDTDGIDPDGSPEFPEKVIGKWICRGWILGDPMAGESGPSAITTQYFELGDEYGNRTIITDGYEYMQPGASFTRAIIGGSGEYRSARGEQFQEILGINEFMGMAMRFELRLEK